MNTNYKVPTTFDL